MTGNIIQISVSTGGIPKRPIAEAQVTPQGILGDSWAHPQFHGGPNQAVLIVTIEGIKELIAQGFPLYPGALGENLTVEGLDRREMRLGQRFQVANGLLIELTKMRSPCSTLDIYGSSIEGFPIQRAVYDAKVRAGDASSPRWGLGGFYARVLHGGTIRTRDIIRLVDQVV
jgi:MOSC domain-containing protein YiiM